MTVRFTMTAIAIMFSLLLASCGGGGGGGGGGSTAPIVTGDNGDNGNNGNGQTPTHGVRNFVDLTTGMDVGRDISVFRVYEIASRTDENNIVFLSDSIQDFAGVVVDVSGVNYTANSGMARVGEASYTVLDSFTGENGFGLLLSDANDELVVVVGSDPYIELPMGSIRYEGRNVSSRKTENSGETTHDTLVGTFRLDVDFAAGTGTIEASSMDSGGQIMVTRRFTGTISVTSANGTFTGSGLTHTSTTGSGSNPENLAPVTIGGIFNGSQGTGVSGVYYTIASDGSSDYSGYILGNQVDNSNDGDDNDNNDDTGDDNDQDDNTGGGMQTPTPVTHTISQLHAFPNNTIVGELDHEVFDSAKINIAGRGVKRYSGRVKADTSGFKDSYVLFYLADDIASFNGGQVDISTADTSNNSGTVSVGGTSLDVHAADVVDNNFGVILWDDQKPINKSYVLTGGEPFYEFATIPSGNFRYTGDWVFGDGLIKNLFDEVKGTFTMNVDFSANTGRFSASAAELDTATGASQFTDYELGGNLTVDNQNGTFSSNPLYDVTQHFYLLGTTFANRDSATPFQPSSTLVNDGAVVMYGSFHGTDASHVTGILYGQYPITTQGFTSYMQGYIIGKK